MAAADLLRVLRAGGRLASGPTDLAAAYPHGGTALGLVNRVLLRPVFRRRVVRAEEYGGEVVDELYAGADWVLVGTLRDFDPDAVNLLFPNTALPTGTGQLRSVRHPGATRAGTLLSARSVVLVFSPNDLDRMPMVLFYRALPLVDVVAEVALSIEDPLEVAFAFRAIRRAADGDAVAWGLRGALAL